MHLISCLAAATLALAILRPAGAQPAPAGGPRQTILFDRDWRFHAGEAEGADQPGFADAAWRSLDLPHDWMIEGVPGADPATMAGPFDEKSPAGAGGGYLNGGVGWYRKTFTVPDTFRGQQVTVLFDGAYMDSEVTCNGRPLGRHPYGFTSFSYDLTPLLHYGAEKNVLSVRLKVQQPSCRWYSGAGLYRHVWLIVTSPVHIALWGTTITTPRPTPGDAQVAVATRVVAPAGVSAAAATLTTILLDPSGREVGRQQTTREIQGAGETSFQQTFPLATAQLWSTETPALYHAVSEVRVGGALADSCRTAFGIRSIEFRKDEGFFLNGKRIPLNGVCNHHDLGCLGAAAFDRGIERQLRILKDMGCNALRTSHNPPAPALLDLCDELGILVMDEAFDEWKLGKTKYGYGRFFDEWAERDLVSMVRRDRNHPCIILWSIGNEVTEGFKPGGAKVATFLQDIVHREDPTRQVTSAAQQPYNAVKYGFDRALDIFGVNYTPTLYQNAEVRARETMIGSETASSVDTRGEYGLKLGPDGSVSVDPRPANQVSCYDLFFPSWATNAEQEELALQQAPWMAGEFVWTGFDYLGEPTPYKWPSRSSYFGFIDTCGFPKDRFYLYASVWGHRPVVHLLPSSWNWPGFEGRNIPVWVYTNADAVELFLNGRSLGVKRFPADVATVDLPGHAGTGGMPPVAASQGPSLHLGWNVPYAPGSLRAVATRKGAVIATDEILTAGAPARLVLATERPVIDSGGQDLAFIKVAVVDEAGLVCPHAADAIRFDLSGEGAVLAGVDNGDPTNHESFQGSGHRAFHGLALVVLKSRPAPGSAVLKASAPGLAPAEITIRATPPAVAPATL